MSLIPVHPPATTQPPRVLGPVDATCVVIGAVIGVGIFFNPSQVAALCPTVPLALLAWGIAGVIALCGSLVFAELGSMYHGSGAQYDMLRDSYGPLIGFLFVFCNATAIQTGSAGIISIICAQNLCAMAGLEPVTPLFILLLSTGLIVGLAAANIIGVRWGSQIQNLTVYAKVLTLLAITGLALFAAPREPAIAQQAVEVKNGLGPVVGLLAALVPTLFAFGGWQQALWVAGEVRDPARALPRAIIAGVALVTTVYLLVNWAYLHLLGPVGVAESKALAADAVAVVLPAWAPRLVAAAVAVSAFGVLNAQLLTGPRLVFSLARDGRFFSPFSRLDLYFGTPVPAILLLAVISVLLLIAAGERGIDLLLTGVVFIDGVFFVLTAGALVVLHRRRPNLPRTMRVPARPLVVSLFLIGEIGVVIGAYLDPTTRSAAGIGAAWIIAGVIVYFALFFRPHERWSPQ